MHANAAADSTVESAIELSGVVKDFASGLRGVKLRALHGVDLCVRRGEVFGLLGPNGSGKSTAIKLILGLLKPTAGTCLVFGASSADVATHRAIGYLPESPNFYPFLTARELVRFYAKMCGLRGATLEERVTRVLADVGLAGAEDRRVGTFSRGMLQRAGLAQALVHGPELLILDEPTGGLDPQGIAEITALISRLKSAGKTILLTSHLLAPMEEVCDRVAILDRGRIILEGTLFEILSGNERQALVIDAMPLDELNELRSWLAERGRALAAIEPCRTRLDQVFLEHVAREREL